jgi:hypothetical protein
MAGQRLEGVLHLVRHGRLVPGDRSVTTGRFHHDVERAFF